MSKAAGRSTPASLGRRIVCDLLHAGMRFPSVAIQKTMELREVEAARRRASPRPSWCAIFTKAYGTVVSRRPDLRRAFLTFPTERLYEYVDTRADVVLECRLDGENVLAFAGLKHPESCPLPEIDRRLAACKQNPVGQVRRFRRALGLARLPRLVRRAVWWFLLNVSGRKRGRYFGTFGVTSVGNWGVESLRPVAPCISLLHYGVVDPQGRITMRLTYDHRVLDGSGPATALVEMEKILQTETIAELDTLREGEPATVLPRAG